MVKSDILLDNKKIDAIPADGSFNLATETDAEPDIRLSPNSAAIRLGGGDGNYSDGDVRLLDRPDDGTSKPRVHLTGGTGKTHSGTRVRINGKDGLAKLGASSVDSADIELRSALAQLRLGGGAGDENDPGGTVGNVRLDDESQHSRVFIGADGSAPPDGSENAAFLTSAGSDGYGYLSLKRAGEAFADATVTLDAESSQLTLGSSTGSGDLVFYRQGIGRTVYVNGHEANVGIGGDPSGGGGVSGSIDVSDSTDETTVSIAGARSSGDGGGVDVADGSGQTTVSIAGDRSNGDGGGVDVGDGSGQTTVSLLGNRSSGDGGGVTVANGSGNTTADLDGGSGTLTLGSQNENGTVSLEDGTGMTVDLEADDGSVTLQHHDPSKGEIGLELEPENGVFSVFDGNGDPVFRIDTQSKSIEKARGYSRGVIGTGKPDSPGQGNSSPSQGGN